MSTEWKPTPASEQSAVRLLAVLLADDPDEQCDVLALTCRLWCYQREYAKGAFNA